MASQGYADYPPADETKYPMQPVQQQPGYGYGTGPPPVHVQYVAAPVKPENHMLFSVLVCLFCNCVCGLCGIYHSMKVDSFYMSGNYPEAEEHSRQARQCSMIGLVVGTVVIVVTVVAEVVLAVVMAQQGAGGQQP